MGGICSCTVVLSERAGCIPGIEESGLDALGAAKNIACLTDVVGTTLGIAGAVTVGVMHELEKIQQGPHPYTPIRK